MKSIPGAAVWALSMISSLTWASLAQAEAITATVVYKGGEEHTYSVKDLTEKSAKFPIYLSDSKLYIFRANWNPDGGNRQLFALISDPSIILPPSTGDAVSSAPAHPLAIFENSFTYTPGKRQLAFTAPGYAIWFQIDDEKAAAVSEPKKQPLLTLEAPTVENLADGVKNITCAIKAHGDVVMANVKIMVFVYEKDAQGKLSQTEGRVSFKWTSPPVDWKEGGVEDLLIEYPGSADPAKKYAGYIIGIYYGDELQSQRMSAEAGVTLSDFPLPDILNKGR